ncbi:MAG TPA: molybdopterin dinucleotide binding domain-containing protein, partial [Dehalococcoidia bacterium]
IMRLQQAHDLRGEARQGWRVISDLGKRLAERLGTGEIRITYPDVGDITDEIAQVVPQHAGATWRELDSGTQQRLNGAGPKSANRVAVQAIATSRNGGFTLATGRGLYTSYEGAAVHSPEADKLHREDSVKMHPNDAAALGVTAGDEVVLRKGAAEVRAPVAVTAAVQPKMLYLPLYYDGGAVSALFDADSPVAQVEVTRA